MNRSLESRGIVQQKSRGGTEYSSWEKQYEQLYCYARDPPTLHTIPANEERTPLFEQRQTEALYSALERGKCF